MQLISGFSTTQYTRALESWGWLDIVGKTPLFTSPFGDVFLQGTDGVWFLDSIGGSLERLWDSLGALEEDLASPRLKIDTWSLAHDGGGTRRQGARAGPDLRHRAGAGPRRSLRRRACLRRYWPMRPSIRSRNRST
jgi:hypothetical protein